MLHVWCNGVNHVVAESVHDAWVVWREHTGERRENYELDYPWTQEPDDKPLRVWGDADTGVCGCLALAEVDRKERRQPYQDREELRALIEQQRVDPRHIKLPPVFEAKTGRRFLPNGHLDRCPVGSQTKTCAAWIAETGRGFLCSTEY